MWAGVSKSGSPISRWITDLPWRSRARARASTSKADSVPSRPMRSATSITWSLPSSRDFEFVILPCRGAGAQGARAGRGRSVRAADEEKAQRVPAVGRRAPSLAAAALGVPPLARGAPSLEAAVPDDVDKLVSLEMLLEELVHLHLAPSDDGKVGHAGHGVARIVQSGAKPGCPVRLSVWRIVTGDHPGPRT